MTPDHPSIVIVCPQLGPETNAAARRISELARHLVAAGWTVRVVAQAPHHPQNRVFPGFGLRRKTVTTEDGALIVRYRPWLVPRSNFALRFASETLFALQAALHVLPLRPDLIAVSIPYMAVGPLGLLVARLRGARFAFDVRDLTWQYLGATGRPTWGLDRLLGRVMRFTARHADVLTTATEGQLDYFEDRPALAEVITNGLAAAFLDRLQGPPRERAAGAPPRVLYAGLLGFPQGMGILVDVAARLPGVTFSLVGDGPERAGIEAEVRSRGLTNVELPGFVDGEALAARYWDADVLVAHLRRDPAFAIAQPSKLWEYMAAGRPVVFGGEGEAVRILERERIGVTVPPEAADAMAAAIQELLDDPQRAADLAGRARAFVERHRNRDVLLARWASLLRAAVAR